MESGCPAYLFMGLWGENQGGPIRLLPATSHCASSGATDRGSKRFPLELHAAREATERESRAFLGRAWKRFRDGMPGVNRRSFTAFP